MRAHDHKFVVATPGRSVCDDNARALASIDALRFLALGFVCNLAVRPVSHALFTTIAPGVPAPPRPGTVGQAVAIGSSRAWVLVGAAWALAAIPLGWGVMKTLTLAGQIFQ